MGVTTDPAEVAAVFAQRTNMRYPIAVDPKGDTSRAYGVSALPTLFVIDKRGVVRDVAIGYDEGGTRSSSRCSRSSSPSRLQANRRLTDARSARPHPRRRRASLVTAARGVSRSRRPRPSTPCAPCRRLGSRTGSLCGRRSRASSSIERATDPASMRRSTPFLRARSRRAGHALGAACGARLQRRRARRASHAPRAPGRRERRCVRAPGHAPRARGRARSPPSARRRESNARRRPVTAPGRLLRASRAATRSTSPARTNPSPRFGRDWSKPSASEGSCSPTRCTGGARAAPEMPSASTCAIASTAASSRKRRMARGARTARPSRRSPTTRLPT